MKKIAPNKEETAPPSEDRTVVRALIAGGLYIMHRNSNFTPTDAVREADLLLDELKLT